MPVMVSVAAEHSLYMEHSSYGHWVRYDCFQQLQHHDNSDCAATHSKKPSRLRVRELLEGAMSDSLHTEQLCSRI